VKKAKLSARNVARPVLAMNVLDPLAAQNEGIAVLAAATTPERHISDAQVQAQRVLELEENHAGGAMLLTFALAYQEKWAEALRAAEKDLPSYLWLMGTLSGVLRRVGESGRAD
jgi:hypothetical protein